MIYLLEDSSGSEHSKMLSTIISEHTSIEIRYNEIEDNSTLSSISSILTYLLDQVTSQDIVLCAWSMPYDAIVDNMFVQLTDKCWVVAAAGNNGQLIDGYIPANTRNVITVGCLNKSGNKAALSNYSADKNIVWVPGTNYSVNGILKSGTSISAALYSAFLAEAIAARDSKIVDQLINKHKDNVRLD